MTVRRQILNMLLSTLATCPGLVSASEKEKTRYSPGELPVAIVAPGETVFEEGIIGCHDLTLSVDITILAAGSGAVPELEDLAANIMAVVKTSYNWNGLALMTNPGTLRIANVLTGDHCAGINLTIDIVYRVSVWTL